MAPPRKHPKHEDIVVVGSATSHGLASVHAVRRLLPSRQVIAVGFDDVAAAAARGIDGVLVTDALPSPVDLGGVIFAADMALHVELLASLLDARIPVFIHKPAVRNREGLELLRRALGNAPELVLMGSILRYAEEIRSRDVRSAAEVVIAVEHPLCRRQETEDPRAWAARVTKDFGIHGLDLLDQLGRRPRTCTAATWDATTSTLTLSVDGGSGTDRVTLAALSRREEYRISTGQDTWSLPGSGADPLGHEAAHRVFVDMVRGSAPPVPLSVSLALLAATFDAAEHAQLAISPSKEIVHT